MKVHPLTLALAIVALDLVVVTLALLADARQPELILLVLNVFVLLMLYFVHASGGIRFNDDVAWRCDGRRSYKWPRAPWPPDDHEPSPGGKGDSALNREGR